jgi:hypothetical protein
MIRKLKSGEHRLYSRKKNPRTGKRRNLGNIQNTRRGRKARTSRRVFQASLILGECQYLIFQSLALALTTDDLEFDSRFAAGPGIEIEHEKRRFVCRKRRR